MGIVGAGRILKDWGERLISLIENPEKMAVLGL